MSYPFFFIMPLKNDVAVFPFRVSFRNANGDHLPAKNRRLYPAAFADGQPAETAQPGQTPFFSRHPVFRDPVLPAESPGGMAAGRFCADSGFCAEPGAVPAQ